MKYKLIVDKDAIEEIVATVHEPSELTDQIENLVLTYKGKDSIMAYREDEITNLTFPDIECITVIDRKTFAIDSLGAKYRINHRLCELEEMLPSYFIRINKSGIANKSRIVRFKTSFNGAVDVIFKCGYTDYVSRRCFADIKRRIET